MTVPELRLHSAIVKIASRCNLNCSYCYVYNHEDDGYLRRPPFMERATYEATLNVLARHCDRHAPHRVSILFHGGEPLLAGRPRLSELAGRARDVLGPRLRRLAIQTNATLIDEEWARLLADLQIDVSVSLDGTPAAHDAVRVDHQNRGSYEATVRGLEHLRKAKLDPYVLCVINPAHSGLAVFDHFLSLGLKRFDFLLPDVSHDNKPFRYGSAPHPVADYLLPVFDSWIERDDPSIRIRLFEDLLTVLLGGPDGTDSFGNIPLRYVIVEADGAIEGLDALRVCGNGIASTGLNVKTHSLDDLQQGSPLIFEAATSGFPIPDACKPCPERDVCGGGYPPHRFSRSRGFNNPSVWCRDILMLLAHMRARIGRQAHA